MLTLNENYITSVFKLPGTSTIVILNGIYQPELSDPQPIVILKNQTLEIPENTQLEKPLHLLFLASQNYHCSFEITAKKSSYTTIIEEYASLGDSIHTNNIKTSIMAEEDSSITHYKLQTENISTADHQIKTTINQAQNSKISSFLISVGAKTATDTLHIKLSGKNASYSIKGINLLRDTQNTNLNLLVEHLAPNCSSNVLFKGIINDHATSNFDCRVVVHPGAIKTETHVTNKNLLLNKAATANTSPELEVYADDVICTHGATVGQLDQEAIFYLRSRGIEKNRAINLLTAAFTQEITDQFPKFDRLQTLMVSHEQ